MYLQYGIRSRIYQQLTTKGYKFIQNELKVNHPPPVGGFSGWCVSERVGGRGDKKWGASTTLSMLRHPVQTHYLFKVNPVRLYLAYRVQTKHCLLAPTGYTRHALLVT